VDCAVTRLRNAARQRQVCAIVGDFDCDGLGGTALLAEGLAAMGLGVRTLLPHRLRDGYGLATHHVETLATEGIRLLVTVDCGSTAHAALERAAQLGVTVIVTDHHPPRGPLPPCAALVNPRRGDSLYPDRDLCGAGVAHLLLRALAQAGAGIDPDAGLDLAALSTIADVVSLRGENRVLVRRGLARLVKVPRPGLRALLEVSGVSRLTLSSRDVAFELAPRLNAAGRLGSADPALALLLARRPRHARPLAAELDMVNARRRALTRAATEEAVGRIEAVGGPGPLIVTWAPDWHAGVVGLVASRLVERYGRPAIVLGQLDGRWRGSARSVEGFDIAEALGHCAGLLQRYGGHPMAAGLEVADERSLGPLRRRLEDLAAQTLSRAGRPQPVVVDVHLAAGEVDWRLAEAACAMQPCGAGWPEPVVVVHGATVLEAADDGNSPRLRIAAAGGMALTALPRRAASSVEAARMGSTIDLAAIPVVRDRRGYRCLELEILDAHPAGRPADQMLPRAMVKV
jgi:single-stranded-DNA-specific exonuclease